LSQLDAPQYSEFRWNIFFREATLPYKFLFFKAIFIHVKYRMQDIVYNLLNATFNMQHKPWIAFLSKTCCSCLNECLNDFNRCGWNENELNKFGNFLMNFNHIEITRLTVYMNFHRQICRFFYKFSKHQEFLNQNVLHALSTPHTTVKMLLFWIKNIFFSISINYKLHNIYIKFHWLQIVFVDKTAGFLLSTFFSYKFFLLNMIRPYNTVFIYI
jgi:hypothetical protein